MKIQKLKLLTCALGVFYFPNIVQAWSINAFEVYKQAQVRNENYLNVLRRYNNVIDVTDTKGNTAYCLALKYEDKDTGDILLSYGANPKHQCVKNIENEKNKKERREQNLVRKRNRFAKSRYASNDIDHDYLWWGLGALTVGGGVAALSGGGGGGGSADVKLPDGDGEVLPPKNEEFVESLKTTEYKNGNFLEHIKAAEAYAYMYDQDSSGNLFSHQAQSHEALKKIKVGIIDSGVYQNNDLSMKFVNDSTGKNDINDYNNLGNVRGYISDGKEYYIFDHEGKKYTMRHQNGKYVLGVFNSQGELNSYLREIGVRYEDFSVMNGGDGINPGSSNIKDFLPLPDNATKEDLLKSGMNWINIIGDLHHGTHVAGIIAGNKNGKGSHGVAFENAGLVVGSWDFEHNIHNTVKNMVDSGVDVLNNSWNVLASDRYNASTTERYISEISDTIKAYAYMAKNKGVWVQAAGNESYHDAGLDSGIGGLSQNVLSQYGYYGAGKYEAPFLSVVALDPSLKDAQAPVGKLAGYSNWCGSTSGYCIAAPGTNINSTAAVENGQIVESGTSMATPVVTGSVSLLMGYYPWLSAQNVSYLLLETANDQGEYANKDKYGKGALDLEAAVTTPIGNLGLPISASVNDTVVASTSKVALSGVIQNKLLKSLPDKIKAFDELNRPFDYDTEKMVQTTHASNVRLRNEVARVTIGDNRKIVKNEKVGLSFSTTESADKGGNANLTTAEVIHESEGQSSRFYYTENSTYEHAEDALVNSNNPYFAMNEAYGAENTINLGEFSKLKLSLQTGENGLYERDYEQDKHAFNERSYAFSGEYSFGMTDYLELAATGGMLFENDALLGMNGTGALGIGDTSTYFMGIKADLNLTSNISLLAAYYRGYTQGNEASMLQVSGLQTESFMLAGEYKFLDNSKLGVSFSSPLSVVKGHANLSYAVGRDNYSDKVYLVNSKSSLRPEAKEYDLGLYYQGKPNKDLGIMGKIQTRFNADGEKGLNDYMGILGVQYNF